MPLASFFHWRTVCSGSLRCRSDFVQFLARLQILADETGKVCPISIAAEDTTGKHRFHFLETLLLFVSPDFPQLLVCLLLSGSS